MKRPSFQFYPGDWQRDTRLRVLSLTAKGLWIEMLCIMHEAEPYGHLVIGEQPVTMGYLARYVGLAPRQVDALRKELEEAGVFSRTPEGVIYSRRMVRDEEFRTLRGSFGFLGSEHGERAVGNANASRKGEARGGGRPKKTPLNGDGRGDKKPPLQPGIEPPPSSSSSSSYPLPSVEAPPVWFNPIDEGVTAMKDRELRQLDPSDRVLLGRFHVFRFGNCTKTESRNASKGAAVAAALASMGATPEFADLSVAEYLLVAERYFNAQGGKPWFKPFDVKAMLPVAILERRNGHR